MMCLFLQLKLRDVCGCDLDAIGGIADSLRPRLEHPALFIRIFRMRVARRHRRYLRSEMVRDRLNDARIDVHFVQMRREGVSQPVQWPWPHGVAAGSDRLVKLFLEAGTLEQSSPLEDP